jgi:predicted esterase
LTAPDAYGFSPTRIDFLGGAVGPVHTIFGPGATAHSIAQQQADAISQETSPHAIAGTVRDCTIGGEAAAAYGFSNGTISGFYIYSIDHDGLFEVFLFGTGGLGNQAIKDSLGMISSLNWTS